MLKKLFYYSIFIVSLILFHNLFLKRKFELPKRKEPTVTEKIDYRGEHYHFIADRLLEKNGEKELYNIRVKFEGMDIEADRASTKNMQQITFSNNVRGKNSDWEFRCDSMEYDVNSREVKARGNFVAENAKDKVYISGNECKSSDSFKRVKLSSDVKIDVSNVKFECGNLDYISDEGLMDLKDGAKVSFEGEISGKKGNITIISDGMRYEESDGEIRSYSNFNLVHEDTSMRGEGFTLRHEPLSFNSMSEVEITNGEGELSIKANSAQYDNRLKLGGGVEGEGKEGKFSAREVVSEDLNLFNFEGGLKISNDKVSVKSLSGIYDRSREFFDFYGDPCEMDNGKNRLLSPKVSYELKGGRVRTEGEFKALGEDFEIMGSSLNYGDEEEVSIENVELQKGDQHLKGGKVVHIGGGEYYFSGGLELSNNQISASPSDMILDTKSEKITMDKSFKIALKKEDVEICVEDCEYDIKSENLFSSGFVEASKDDFLCVGKKMEYNGIEGIFKLGSSGHLQNRVEGIESDFDSFEFNTKSNIGLFVQIDGSKGDVDFSSSQAQYLRGEELINFSNLDVKKEGIKLKAPQVVYRLDGEEFAFKGEAIVIKEEMVVVAEGGSVDLKDRTLLAKKVVAFRENGDIVEGGDAFLDYNGDELTFRAGIEGELKKGVIFSAERGKVFFEKDEESLNEHKIIRAELKSNALFRQEGITMKANYVEYDSIEDWVFGKDNLRLHVEYGDEVTDIRSQYAFVDVNHEIARMKNRVIITHKNSKVGTINANADYAFLKRREDLIGLKGHVKAYGTKGDLKVKSEEAILDLKTLLLKGKGKTQFSYNTGHESSSLSTEKGVIENIKEEFLRAYGDDLKELQHLKESFQKAD